MNMAENTVPVAPSLSSVPSTKEEWKAAIGAYLQEQEAVLIGTYVQKMQEAQNNLKGIGDFFTQKKAELEARYEAIEQEIRDKRSEQNALEEEFKALRGNALGQIDQTSEASPFHTILQEFHQTLDHSFFKEKREEFLGRDAKIRQMCFELYKLGEDEAVIKDFIRKAEEIWQNVQSIEKSRLSFLRDLASHMKALRKNFQNGSFRGTKGFWARMFGRG